MLAMFGIRLVRVGGTYLERRGYLSESSEYAHIWVPILGLQMCTFITIHHVWDDMFRKEPTWDDEPISCSSESVLDLVFTFVGNAGFFLLAGSSIAGYLNYVHNAQTLAWSLSGAVLLPMVLFANFLYRSLDVFDLPSGFTRHVVLPTLLHWVAVIGLVFGTFCLQQWLRLVRPKRLAIDSSEPTAPKAATRSWPSRFARTIWITSGLIGPAMWLKNMKQQHASMIAIWRTFRDRPVEFASATVAMIIWTLAYTSLFADLLPLELDTFVILASLLTLSNTLVLQQPSLRNVWKSNREARWTLGEVICGRDPSLQVVFSIYVAFVLAGIFKTWFRTWMRSDKAEMLKIEASK